MKHFFFSYNAESYPNGILRGLLDKYMNPNISEKEKLKILFDLTDIIADKRFEDSDRELDVFVKEPNDDNLYSVRQFCKLLPFYKKSGESYRIIALRRIWQYVETEFEIYKNNHRILDIGLSEKNSCRLINLVLYHLVRGNICLRISQRYYENNNLKESEIWGERAIELLWHGKNLAVNFRDIFISDSEEKIEADLYLRLIKLNLAKYFRDYARRNRRSDFDAALDEFKQVRKRAEEGMEKTNNQEQKRQYALIWLDAIFHIAKIHRRKYLAGTAKYEMQFFYRCLEKQIRSDDSAFCHKKNDSSSISELFDGLDNLIYDSSDENKENELLDLDDIDQDSFSKCFWLDDYDRRRYLLLVLLEISRIRRDLHMPDNYSRSIATAIVVDKLSYEMDKRDGYIPGHNIDALITISSSLRKYVKFQDSASRNVLPSNKLSVVIDNKEYELFLRSDEGVSSISADLNSFINKLREYAKKEHMKSKSEVIKWHCLYLQKKGLLKSIGNMVGDYAAIKSNFENNNKNPQFRFLQGLVMFRSGQYKKAIKIFEKIISPNHKETQYIRQGTIGLKSGYLLANCYIALTEYSKAESILKDLKEKLAFAKKSRMQQGNENSSDAEADMRVEIDLGYCYMQRGDYKEAFKIYHGLFGEGDEKTGQLEFQLPCVKKERCIMGLNNYAVCCIFSLKENEDTLRKRLEIARKIFIYMDHKFFGDIGENAEEGYEDSSETDLLKGYYTLLTGSIPSVDSVTGNQINYCKKICSPGTTTIEIKSLIDAHKYFRESIHFNEGFTPRYHLLDEKKMGNRNIYRAEVEKISAYIISLTKLWGIYDKILNNSFDLNENISEEDLKLFTNSGLNLERFLLGFPTNYEISLKAAIALAEWILRYESREETVRSLADQLYRSFSYLTIYEERGARVFNILRDNNKFRFFTAVQRGKFLALLLAMYKPIKAIKEECCFNITDMEKMQHLVHYTSTESLKKILDCDDIRKNISIEPRFRILNSGYMNDVFEGNVFLKGIEMVSDIESSDTMKIQEYKEFIKSYFPQLNRSHEDMRPSGSCVYIGSLSVKPDSFSMWSVYAKNESGCNIEFGEHFFDIKGNSCYPGVLREYMISKYTDWDYPLYIVQYLGKEFAGSYQKNVEKEDDDFEIQNVNGVKQKCDTEAIDYEDLYRLLKQIYRRWRQLDEYLEKLDGTNVDSESKEVIRAFAADRINEIRYLFKDSDYEFEGEVRVVYTDFTHRSVSKIDFNGDVPRVYVELNRDLQDLTVRLGSRIEDATVDKYVTWLEHTGRVKKIGLANRNRYTK